MRGAPCFYVFLLKIFRNEGRVSAVLMSAWRAAGHPTSAAGLLKYFPEVIVEFVYIIYIHIHCYTETAYIYVYIYYLYFIYILLLFWKTVVWYTSKDEVKLPEGFDG